LKASLTDPIERVINRVLSLDEESLLALSRHEGRTAGIDLVNTDLSFHVRITRSGISLSARQETAPDVTIRGRPQELLSYLVAAGTAGSGSAGALEISGDIALAQELQRIFTNLDIDWEEEIARWLGDTLARKAGNITRASIEFTRRTGATIRSDISEYLRFEARMLPDGTEIAGFNRSVDTLRHDVERLKARVLRLQQRVERGGTG